MLDVPNRRVGQTLEGMLIVIWQLEENCERDRSIPVIRSLPARCWPGSGGQRRLNIGNYYLLDAEGTGRTARPGPPLHLGGFAAVQRPLIGSTPVRQFTVVYNSQLGEVFFVIAELMSILSRTILGIQWPLKSSGRDGQREVPEELEAWVKHPLSSSVNCGNFG
jgi:hypothetical protein